MTPATRRQLRAAVLALPACEREHHLAALAGLLHLLDHCAEGREPVAFVAGRCAFQLAALRWATELVEHPWRECDAPDCSQPNHVSLISVPIEVAAGTDR